MRRFAITGFGMRWNTDCGLRMAGFSMRWNRETGLCKRVRGDRMG